MENILYISLYTLNLKECYLAKTKIVPMNTETMLNDKLEMLEHDEHVKYFISNFQNKHLYLKFV